MKKVKTIILITISVLLLLAIAGGVGLYVYSKNNRSEDEWYHIFDHLTQENVEKITLSYTPYMVDHPELIDYEFDYSLDFSMFTQIQVKSPFKEQNVNFYGDSYFCYKIYTKDGTVHEVRPLGTQDEYEDTGYELATRTEDGYGCTYTPIVRHNEYHLVEIDGVTYAVQDYNTLDTLFDLARPIIRQYEKEIGYKTDATRY
ncbi:MAG: hypothetical protein IJ493_09250 [Clostridia bacterium]|nr:hypothetical protein [Clostridia bacterium]